VGTVNLVVEVGNTVGEAVGKAFLAA